MSTYTDLHARRRENLTILRMPGNPDDGITPQRVIFANPENIYEGTFKGTIQSEKTIFKDISCFGGLINGTLLENCTIKSGNTELNINELTSNISEMQENIDDLQTSAENLIVCCDTIATEGIENACEQLSGNLVVYITKATNSLCTEILNEIDEISNVLSNDIKQNSLCINYLSGALVNEVKDRKDADDEINVAMNSVKSNIDTVSHDLSIETFIRLSVDEQLSHAIDNNKLEIDDIRKNIKGGLNYVGNLKVDMNLGDNNTLSNLVIQNYVGISITTPLRNGFFYVASTLPENRSKTFSIEGLDVECGDWLIINTNCSVETLTSAYVSILDAEDYDNFKLTGDNDVSGNNVFHGNTAIDKLSIDGLASMKFSDTSSLQDLSNDIYGTFSSMSNFISSELSNETKYFGSYYNATSTEYDVPLSNVLNAVFGSISLRKGYMFRIETLSVSIIDSISALTLNHNDYVIINKDIAATTDAKISDLDIIRDAQSEGGEIQGQISALSTYIDSLSTDEMSMIDSNCISVISTIKQSKGQLNITAKALDYNAISGLTSKISNDIDAKVTSLSMAQAIDDGKVITNVTQSNGIVSVDARKLSVDDIDGLNDALSTKLDVTGGTISGTLNIAQSLNVVSSVTLLGGQISGAASYVDAIAIGRNATAKNDDTFVWSPGIANPDNRYVGGSDRQGTFSIDATLNDVWIGEQTLCAHLSAMDATTKFNRLTSDLSTTLSAIQQISSFDMSSTIEDTLSAVLLMRNIISGMYLSLSNELFMNN